MGIHWNGLRRLSHGRFTQQSARVMRVARLGFLAVPMFCLASAAIAQTNLVPNPGFQNGSQAPFGNCFTRDYCNVNDDFDDRIDNWKAAIANPNCPCATCEQGSPDWIDDAQCPTFYTAQYAAPTNTSSRFVLLINEDDHPGDGAEAVRVGLNSALRINTQYVISLRMAVGEDQVSTGGQLRLHLTKFGEHWNSTNSDNIRMTDFTNFIIPAGAAHEWYLKQLVFAIDSDKDNQLGNLVLETHYNNPYGHNIYIDDVSLSTCTASFTQQPLSVDAFSGDDVSFTVDYSAPPGATLAWRKVSGPPTDFNDGRHSGMDTNTLTITGVIPNDSGSYAVDITYACGLVTSSQAILTVCPEHLVITQQPATPITVNEGAAVTMTVVATGPAPLTYHWNSATHMVGLGEGPRIHGTASPELTIDPVKPIDSGTYFADVGSDCESEVSQNVVLTVIGRPGGDGADVTDPAPIIVRPILRGSGDVAFERTGRPLGFCVTLVDARGRLWWRGCADPGTRTLEWRNGSGSSTLRPGIYFARIEPKGGPIQMLKVPLLYGR